MDSWSQKSHEHPRIQHVEGEQQAPMRFQKTDKNSLLRSQDGGVNQRDPIPNSMLHRRCCPVKRTKKSYMMDFVFPCTQILLSFIKSVEFSLSWSLFLFNFSFSLLTPVTRFTLWLSHFRAGNTSSTIETIDIKAKNERYQQSSSSEDDEVRAETLLCCPEHHGKKIQCVKNTIEKSTNT